MAKKNKQEEEEVILDVGQSLTRVERYFEENKKSISVIAIALVVLVGGYFAYLELYQKPLEEEAKNEIYQAQQFFEADSFRLAVNGNPNFPGFVTIAEEYSGTKAGNLANYYAGISYLNMGDYRKAIEYLDEFSSDDPIYSVIARGGIGDAFWEIDQPEEALNYYREAVNGEENSLVVPFYLMKAGLVAEELGRYEDALKYYRRIKTEFPDSPQATDIDKYIGHAEASVNS